MYRYHTRYLGWSDIGYNFLVDRFGRIWTGRAGGARRPVRGAHTLGFNSTSAGVAVIGNFELTRPSDRVLDAVAAVAAWKLQRFDRDPLGNVRVWSRGSDRFRQRPQGTAADDRRPPRHQPDRLPRPPPVPPPRRDPAPRRRPHRALLQGAGGRAFRPARHPGPRPHAHGRPGHLHPCRRRPLLCLAPRRPAHPARLGASVRRAAGRRRHPDLGPHHRPQGRPEARHPPAVDAPGGRPDPPPSPWLPARTVGACGSPYGSRRHAAYGRSRPARWSSRSTAAAPSSASPTVVASRRSVRNARFRVAATG